MEAVHIEAPDLNLSTGRWRLCVIFFIQAALLLTKTELSFSEQQFSSEGNVSLILIRYYYFVVDHFAQVSTAVCRCNCKTVSGGCGLNHQFK